jgi:hypothetical protein
LVLKALRGLKVLLVLKENRDYQERLVLLGRKVLKANRVF